MTSETANDHEGLLAFSTGVTEGDTLEIELGGYGVAGNLPQMKMLSRRIVQVGRQKF
ncbi:MAG: hypothetical protein P8176_00090 [Gammaproteobacteria bacterium]